MDKGWIKAVLIGAFVISLLFVFGGAVTALRQPAYAELVLPKEDKVPQPPPALQLQAIASYSDPVAVAKQIEQMNLQVAAHTLAVKTYEANVTAYAKDIESRTLAWKAKHGDPAMRLTAYEKVVKDTLGALIVTPLLGALLIYSGIKVSGDVAVAIASKSAARIEGP